MCTLFRKPKADRETPYRRGLRYEETVCQYLKKQGYTILDRNFRARRKSEIDVVAKIGETLVFLEVKARKEQSVHSPLHGISEQKRRALTVACNDYLKALEMADVDVSELTVRYDVIALFFDENGVATRLDHYPAYLEMSREIL